ncbi:MAG: PspC domain-containing protein [Verrucomicrobia bacterium]|nr:PspC domain-containing protein [Verrucomicrobiota bacterium]
MNNVFHQSRALYRARDGMIFGVCKGVSRYADIPVFWIRAIFIVLALFMWFLPMVAVYLGAAVLMKPEPVLPPRTDDDWEFYNSYASSRALALARLKRKFEQLERRTRRVEHLITRREFEWDQRLKTGQ